MFFMDLDSEALDISSDEDAGDDPDWLSKLLEEDGWDGNESDEVTVIEEVEHGQRTSKPDLDDDDCVVLDGDPDSLVRDLNDSASGTDDLLVVGEKGQIACRDYPHSRSLCAKFPFDSTPHERHCEMCHCYVCDSPAPCTHWDNGIPILDHCHATDKEEVWRLLRTDAKEARKMIMYSAPSVSPQFNSIPQGQVPGQPEIRAFSPTVNSTLPTILNQGRSVVPENNLVKSRYQTSLISQQLLNSGINDIRGDRVHGSGNLGSRSICHHPTFKKARPVGRVLPRQSVYVSTNNLHLSASDYCQRHQTVSTVSSRNPVNWQGHGQPLNLESFTCLSQPIVGNYFERGGQRQPQTDGQPFWQEDNSETQPLTDPTFVDASLSWQNDGASLGNKNFSNDPQFPRPSDCSNSINYHVEVVSKPYGHSTATEYDCQFAPFMRTPEPSAISQYDPQCPPPLLSPVSLVLKQLEDWLMESQSVPGDFECTTAFEPNVAPPAISAVPRDPGVFFI